jgi:hypothetical protein
MTDIEKVRLKIGTVISATFTDDQIQAFLDMEGSVYLAAAAAIESWAAAAISTMESEKIGDYSYSRKSIDNALAIAQRLRDGEANVPAIDWAEMDLASIGEYPIEEEE